MSCSRGNQEASSPTEGQQGCAAGVNSSVMARYARANRSRTAHFGLGIYQDLCIMAYSKVPRTKWPRSGPRSSTGQGPGRPRGARGRCRAARSTGELGFVAAEDRDYATTAVLQNHAGQIVCRATQGEATVNNMRGMRFWKDWGLVSRLMLAGESRSSPAGGVQTYLLMAEGAAGHSARLRRELSETLSFPRAVGCR